MKSKLVFLTLGLALCKSAHAIQPFGTSADPIIVSPVSGSTTTVTPATGSTFTVTAANGSFAVTSSSATHPVSEYAVGISTNLSGTSPASASTAAGLSYTGLAGYRSLTVVATLTGATGGTLDVYLQVSPDGGTTWVDYAHFAQIAAAAAATTKIFTVSRGGQQTTITAVGTGTSPALAANTVVGGEFTDRIRVLFVAGAGTSAGAAQTILLYAKS